MSSYRALDAGSLVSTLEVLLRRIEERFAGRGIVAVCAELLAIARADALRVGALGRPHIFLRIGVALVILSGLGAIGFGIWAWQGGLAIETEAFSVFQGLEALANLVILTGAGVWFLLNLEARIKRRKALSDLHELRSIAHVIDMHQLTKDPLVVLGHGPSTASSPVRAMTAFELGRYLDYCSEMLSLTAKLAALYLANSRDQAVTAAVDEIQDLTTSLSRKIWQKIALLQAEATRPTRTTPPADSEAPADTINRNVSPLHPFALGE
jgi:hypothetical protein